MRKIPILLLFAVSSLLPISRVQAAVPERRAIIDRGHDLFEFGRWSDARHEFTRARAVLTPADRNELQEVDFYLAACAVELGNPDADAALIQFSERYPGSVYGNDVRFALGSYYCSKDELAKAREAFSITNYKALSASRREQYDVRMGYVEFSDGNYEKAYVLFDRIGKSSRYADHAAYYKAYIHYAEGRYGVAKKDFTALLQSDAYKAVVPYYLLQIEFREGNYRYVVNAGEELARRAVPARRAEIERIMAESWFHLGDFNQTLAHLDAFTESGGEMDRDAHYLKGFSLYRTVRYAEAAEALRKACGAEDALTQNASYHLADCCLRAGDKPAAMQSFGMAADERFNAEIAEDALFNYAKLQYELGGGAFNGAINVLQRYVEKYPSTQRTPEARTLLVAAYYNSNDYDAAYEAIKSMPSADADIRAALQKITYFRGLEALKAGDLEAAKRSLAESAAVNVSPKYTALNSFWQGEIAFAEKDYTLAAARYNAYLQRAPRDSRESAMAHYNLGYCAFVREHMTQAQASFKRFLAAYKTDDAYRADAFSRLGDICYADRKFDAAIVEYEKAIALGGVGKQYAQYKRAVSFGILGHTDQKQQALRQIAAAGEGDYVDEAAYELGRTYIAQERYSEGAAALEKFIADHSESPLLTQALSDLGLAWLNLGDRAKSLKYYNQVVDASPRSTEARDAMQGIRDIYVSQGNVDAYFDYAEKVGMESDLTAVKRDSLSFAAARKLYLDNQDEVAMRSLRSYVKSYPKGYYQTDALYYLSDCYLRLGERADALETLAELAARGQHQYSASVLEKLSAMLSDDKRYDEAAVAYRQLYDVSVTAAAREQAMTSYVRSILAVGDAAKIAVMAADVEAHPDAGATALREARFAHAEQLRAAGQGTEAAKLYKTLAAEVRTAEGSAAGYYVVAELFEGGDMSKTEKAIYAFADKSPRSYWLAKAYILLGDVYLRKGDNFQARATWQSVADGYSPSDDGVVAEAKARISKLN